MSSLVDALLLDPWRDPHDIYIALRDDGQRGSGTAADPYDGGTRQGPSTAGTVTRPLNGDGKLELFVLAPLRRVVPFIDDQVPWEGVVTVGLEGVTGDGASFFNNPAHPGTRDAQIASAVNGRNGLFKILLDYEDEDDEPPAAPDPDDVIIATRAPLGLEPALRFSASLFWEVVVTCASAHGLTKFDVVHLTDDAGSGTVLNGEFIITETPSSTEFKIRVPPIPWPSSSPEVQWRKIIHRFDEIMRDVPAGSVIHIGAGTFQTRGAAAAYIANPSDWTQLHVGYVVKPAQRLLGAGMGQTTLKLMFPVDDAGATVAVWTLLGNTAFQNVDHAEVADLTIDCNAPGHAAFGTFLAPVTCGAVGLYGSFLRLRRVRAINFCAQTLPECFVLFLGAAPDGPPAGNLIEDCVLESPGVNNSHETTLMAVVGTGLVPEARGGIVRHCYLNLTYPPTEIHPEGVSSALGGIETASVDSGVATVTTRRPHGREVGQIATIAGVDPASHPLNGFHPITEIVDEFQFKCALPGIMSFPSQNFDYAVLGVNFQGGGALSGTGCVIEGNAFHDMDRVLYSDTGSTRDVVVRDNYIYGATEAVRFDFTGGLYKEQKAAQVLWDPSPGNELIATCVLKSGEADFGLLPGDAVRIEGVQITIPPNDPTEAPDGSYNGSFTVLSVSSDRREFSYRMREEPEVEPDEPTAENPVNIYGAYQIRRLAYERNVLGISPFDYSPAGHPNGIGSLISVRFVGVPVFLFPGAIIRDNVCGHLLASGQPVTERAALAALTSFSDTIIDGNIIGLEGNFTVGSRPVVIRFRESNAPNTFNNVSPAGAKLGLFEVTSDAPTIEEHDTVDTKVADALLMALL